MFCRYCNKEIDSELVEHISITHADIAIRYLVDLLPNDKKYNMIDNVFPGFWRRFMS